MRPVKDRSILFWFSALLLLLISATLFGMGTGHAAGTRRKLTLMIYMCGSNLESHANLATVDIGEIGASGYDRRQTEVLILTGGASKWADGRPEGENRLYRISPSGEPVRQEYFSRRNMGDPETLSWLLRYGYENYPAEQYALILWDHGEGPMGGVCMDEQFGNDWLTVEEMKQALKESVFAEQKLEWIGFDACLMASAEVAWAVTPYAKYMIASQEREPGTGWNYSFLKGIEGDADGAETGRRIIDEYLRLTEEDGKDRTLSCLRLNCMEDLRAEWNAFFEKRVHQMDAPSFVSMARNRERARSFGLNRAGDTESYDLVDMIDLLSGMSAGENLLRAVRETVVYSRSTLENADGISVYHPMLNMTGYRYGWKTEYGKLDFSSNYDLYIQAFANVMEGERLVYWRGMKTEMQGEEITCQLTPLQADFFLNASLMVTARDLSNAEETWHQLFLTDDVTLDENNVLHARYRGEGLYVVDDSGTFERTSPIEYQVAGDRYYVVLYPYDREGNVADIILAEYTLEENTGMLKPHSYMLYDPDLQNFTSRLPVDFSRYSGFYFYDTNHRMERNEFGEIPAFVDWPLEGEQEKRQIISGIANWNLKFITHSSYAGLLQVMFQILDVQGNWYSSEPLPFSHTVRKQEVSLETETGDLLEATPFGFVDESRQSWKLILGLSLENWSDWDTAVLLDELTADGQPLDLENGVYLPRDETGVLNVQLDLGQSEKLRPLRKIRRVEGRLRIYRADNEELVLEEKAAFTLAPEVDLAPMYRSSSVLPPEEEDWQEPLLIYETDRTSAWLRALSSMNGKLVAVLSYENRSDEELYFCPVFPRNGKTDWNTGEKQFSEAYGYGKNGLRILPGQTEWTPALTRVPAGQSRTDYVQFEPANPLSEPLEEFSFRIHQMGTDEYTLLSQEIRLTIPDRFMLNPEKDRFFREGEIQAFPAGQEKRGVMDLSLKKRVTAETDPFGTEVKLEVPGDTDAFIAGIYRLVLLVDSEDELYDRGIFVYEEDRRETSMDLKKMPLVLPVQEGQMELENGRFTARCLPILTCLSAGEEPGVVLDMVAGFMEDGVYFQVCATSVSFATDCSGYLRENLENVKLILQPGEREARVQGAKWHKYGTPDWAMKAIRVQEDFGLCGESVWEGYLDRADWPHVTAYQTTPVLEKELRLSLCAPEPEDRLYVIFEMMDASGRSVTLPPVPLDEFR